MAKKSKKKGKLKALCMSIKCQFNKMLSLNTSPHEIAIGFAVGSFIVILPSLFLDVPILILLTFLFPKINKLAALSALVVWNPLVLWPLYGVGYFTGAVFFPNLPAVGLDIPLLGKLVSFFSLRFLAGMAVLAAVLAVIGYIALWMVVRLYQKKKAALLREKKKSRA
jgi:uncharacterized protein (DUF2062 family)